MAQHRTRRPLLCRLGLHSAERSQGRVGYCLRDGCDDLLRTRDEGGIWIRYVLPPSGDPPPPSPPPPGPPEPQPPPLHRPVS